MTEVWIRVEGTPIPQGSKTAGKTKDGRPFVRDVNGKALKDWREAVAQATWRSMQEREFQIDALEGPIEMICWFYFDKPPSSKAKQPISRRVGDLDKLLRAVSDGVVDGGGINDDSQITMISGSKQWTDDITTKPGVMIYLNTLENPVNTSKKHPRSVEETSKAQ